MNQSTPTLFLLLITVTKLAKKTIALIASKNLVYAMIKILTKHPSGTVVNAPAPLKATLEHTENKLICMNLEIA